MRPKRPQSGKRIDRGPEPIGEILSRLFTQRGWGRRQGRRLLEQTWSDVVGAEHAAQTSLGSFKRGVLEIVVGNAVVLQELVHFHKRRLLTALRERLPNETILDLRFRAGVVDDTK